MILARTVGIPLGYRIDPGCSMTICGEFRSVVVFYHVPTGSLPRSAEGTWRIVSTLTPTAVLEPNGTWDVNGTVNKTATIYISNTTQPPPVSVTVANVGPDVVGLVIKTSSGDLIPLQLKSSTNIGIPADVIRLGRWPPGATISKIIVGWRTGGTTTGTYNVTATN